MIDWGEEGSPWRNLNEQADLFDKTVKYRCEQKVLNRIDGMITSHSDTRREISLQYDSKLKNNRFKGEVTESFVKIRPENMMAALELLDKIDSIKCRAEVTVDTMTGKINRVVNFEEIKKRWEEYRAEMFYTINSTMGQGSDEGKQVEKFTDLIDKQFVDEPTFRAELSGKLFYDVFFDKYLLGRKLEDEKFEQTFYSFLFDKTPIKTSLTQELSTDEETGLKKISRYISADDQRTKFVNEYGIMKTYKECYQPIIKYSFTQYNYEFYHDILLADDGLPQEIKVNIIEEVKNNIEILVTYRIHRLK